jgi:hypothetical protein
LSLHPAPQRSKSFAAKQGILAKDFDLELKPLACPID